MKTSALSYLLIAGFTPLPLLAGMVFGARVAFGIAATWLTVSVVIVIVGCVVTPAGRGRPNLDDGRMDNVHD